MTTDSPTPKDEQQTPRQQADSEESPPSPPEPSIPFYRRNPVTFCFALLLVAVYGLTTYPNNFRFPTDLVLYLGSFIPSAVEAGQWWRFLTATVLHANPGHLFNNLFGIIVFGGLVEPVIGSGALLALYLFSAVSGLLLSYAMLPHPTIGASTIDFGLIGAYFGLILLLRFRSDRQVFYRELRSAVGFVVLFTAWNVMESPTINVWAHIGGFFGGVLFAALLLAGLRAGNRG